jgi:hypothetical protein
MNQPPVDIGGPIRIGLLQPGQIYILVETDETGIPKYYHVRIVKKTTIRIPRYAVDMDVLNSQKNTIGQRQIILNANENMYVFHKLKTNKLAEAIGKKATRQAIDEVYEGKTGQSAQPGTGPADLIRGFVGVQPPKRAGRKTRRRYQRSLQRKSSRRNR